MTTSNRTRRYAHYYLGLSVVSTVLFGCTVFNFGPPGQLSPTQSTIVVIVLFTALTFVLSISGG